MDATGSSFLEYMRHPSAATFVKDIKRFIDSFSSRDSENDSEAVQEFLRNMEAAFRVHPLWAGCSEEELEGVGEGLEKYVMKKLHARVFRLDDEATRDNRLSNKIDLIQQFVQPEHLDIEPATFRKNEESLCLAQKELQNMNMYKAPGDKLVCILNCCNAITNLLLNESPEGEFSADEFLPVLIYVTIKANPTNLHSNLSYIQKFRSQSRLVSEPAYLFTSMLSAENFIANMDAKSLSMDVMEFEKHMECSRALNLKLSEDSDSGGSRTTNEENDKKLEGVGSSTNPSNKDVGLCKFASISELEDRGARLIRKQNNVGRLFQEYPYLNSKATDLTVANVEDLLHRYKKLVFKFVCLCHGLGESSSSDP